MKPACRIYLSVLQAMFVRCLIESRVNFLRSRGNALTLLEYKELSLLEGVVIDSLDNENE